MKPRTSSYLKRLTLAALLGAALLATAGSADTRPAHSDGMSEAETQLADRTLVPRRIRLIIGYKRPRLA